MFLANPKMLPFHFFEYFVVYMGSVFMWGCVCVCACLCMHAHLHIPVHAHTYTQRHMHACLFIYTNMSIYACVHIGDEVGCLL